MGDRRAGMSQRQLQEWQQKIARKEKFRERKGKRSDADQDSGSVEERTSNEVNRPESGRPGGLLCI